MHGLGGKLFLGLWGVKIREVIGQVSGPVYLVVKDPQFLPNLPASLTMLRSSGRDGRDVWEPFPLIFPTRPLGGAIDLVLV